MAKRRGNQTPFWALGPDKAGRYRNARGQFISRAQWQHWVRQLPNNQRPEHEIVRAHERQAEVSRQRKRREQRKSKGEISTQRPSKAKQIKASKEIQEGKLPESVKTISKRTSEKGTNVRYEVYRFEGLAAEKDIIRLLKNLRDSKENIRTALNIGVGYGKGADWIGSKYDTPDNTLDYVESWRQRESAKIILMQHHQGAPLWWELEVLFIGGKSSAMRKV